MLMGMATMVDFLDKVETGSLRSGLIPTSAAPTPTAPSRINFRRFMR